MNPHRLLYATCSIFLAFSIWCFVDALRISKIELIGAVTYLLLAIFLFEKVGHWRYIALTVLVIHIVFSGYMLYWAIVTHVPTPEEIENFKPSAESSGGADLVAYVFLTESRKNFLIVREISVILVLVFCAYALLNKAVVGLFRPDNA